MELMFFLLLPLFALHAVTAAYEDSTRVGNTRTPRYPPTVRPRDMAINIFPRSSNTLGSSTESFKNVIKRGPESTIATDKCHDQDRNICAEFIVGSNTVNQQIRLNDNGCTPIRNATDIIAINVFDCWCGLWK